MQCDAYNFAKRVKCYKCGLSRPSLKNSEESRNDEENTKATIMIKGSIISLIEKETVIDSQIFEVFSRFAEVKDVRNVRDRHTGNYRDIAFIEFLSTSDADLVVNIHETSPITIDGCPLLITKSKKRQSEKFSQYPSNPDYGYGVPIIPALIKLEVPQTIKTLSGDEYKVPGHYAYDESCGLYYDTHSKHY